MDRAGSGSPVSAERGPGPDKAMPGGLERRKRLGPFLYSFIPDIGPGILGDVGVTKRHLSPQAPTSSPAPHTHNLCGVEGSHSPAPHFETENLDRRPTVFKGALPSG